jgi:hypothetical protein
VRVRLIAIVILFAALAFAGTRGDDQVPTAQPQRSAASGQLADPPAPEADFSAMTAAVSTSATVQTPLVVESRRQVRSAFSISTVSLRLPDVVHGTDKPRFIPLLI